jgi:ATP-dependent DNA helicase RecG
VDVNDADELARALRERERERAARKAKLLEFITKQRAHGARLVELQRVLPALSRSRIQVLLREMARRGAVHVKGRTRGARWYPGRRLDTK